MSMNERKFQLISDEPRLATLLRTRRRMIVPEDIYNWGVDWVEDVGAVMRSRSYKVGFVASSASYAILRLVARVFPATTKLGIVSEALGLR